MDGFWLTILIFLEPVLFFARWMWAFFVWFDPFSLPEHLSYAEEDGQSE